MKNFNKHFGRISIILILLLSANITAQNYSKNVNEYFEGIEIYSEIGKMHNEMATDFITKNKEELKKLNYNQRKMLLIDYFKRNHDTDVTKQINKFEGFEPYEFLKKYKSNVSQHMYEQIVNLLNNTYEVRNNKKEVLRVIDNFKSNLYKEDKYLKNEKEAFLNMIDVYENSLELWYNNDIIKELESQGNTAQKIDEDDYWKIAASDWVGGVAGGLMGGPAGAAVGMVAGSLQSVISLW